MFYHTRGIPSLSRNELEPRGHGHCPVPCIKPSFFIIVCSFICSQDYGFYCYFLEDSTNRPGHYYYHLCFDRKLAGKLVIKMMYRLW